jgi:hypothetical protein
MVMGVPFISQDTGAGHRPGHDSGDIIVSVAVVGSVNACSHANMYNGSDLL